MVMIFCFFISTYRSETENVCYIIQKKRFNHFTMYHLVTNIKVQAFLFIQIDMNLFLIILSYKTNF